MFIQKASGGRAFAADCGEAVFFERISNPQSASNASSRLKHCQTSVLSIVEPPPPKIADQFDSQGDAQV